jgi:hypothetical protein
MMHFPLVFIPASLAASALKDAMTITLPSSPFFVTAASTCGSPLTIVNAEEANARLQGGHAPTVSVKDGRDMITSSAFGLQTFDVFWDARGSDTWPEGSGSTCANQNTKPTSTEADWFVATYWDVHNPFTQMPDEQFNTDYADDKNRVGGAEYMTIVGLGPVLLASITVPHQGVCLVRPTVHLTDPTVKASFNFNDTTLEILIQHLVHPSEPERQSYVMDAETLGVCRNPSYERYIFEERAAAGV